MATSWCNLSGLAAAAAKSLQSCPTLCDPTDGSPPGSPHPQDSPGKNTGVGCHFLLQCMKMKSKSEVAQSCLTLSDPMDCSLPGSSVHGFCRLLTIVWSLSSHFFQWYLAVGSAGGLGDRECSFTPFYVSIIPKTSPCSIASLII